ncbi:gibberellin 2-beta-dioxygenase 8-like [Primulina tabacum]|uniref:gibberellin 2-beta-dioxygenase 8-like n=1 Tax=Primulina tabacum TaxID=48773 RepID=UPI003F5AB892
MHLLPTQEALQTKQESQHRHTMTNSQNLDSYPPFVHQSHGVDHCGNPTKNLQKPESESVPDSDSLPVVDLLSSHPERISESSREWGMFRLVNHGVESKLLSKILECAAEVFSLSFESKQVVFDGPIQYFWGSPAISLAGNSQQESPCAQNLHWLEGFNVPLEKITQSKYEDPLLESFRALLEEYGNQQSLVAEEIFKTMTEDLKFSSTKSKSYLSLASGLLRVYRYPWCPLSELRWGIGEHTDSSVLSILHQDQVGGLQVCKGSKWLDVKPSPGALVVNIGDLMQAMSNDKYVSVKHRVKVNKEKDRISIGYFVFPTEDALIDSSNYRLFTYADFQADRELDFKTLGTKIGLPRYKIVPENPE